MNDRDRILNDKEFWLWLEFAATRWLENSKEVADRRFWIDGFVPERATNTKRGLDVEGVAWVATGGSIQHEYRFVASLPQKLLHRPERSCRIESLCLGAENKSLEVVISSAEGIAQPDPPPDGNSDGVSPVPFG